jgi:hypothetical protein
MFPPMGGGGVCPCCGRPMPDGMAGPSVGPQDAAMMALASPEAGVQMPPGGGGMMAGDPLASLTPQQAAYLLQMLQQTGGGQPSPQPMMG